MATETSESIAVLQEKEPRCKLPLIPTRESNTMEENSNKRSRKSHSEEDGQSCKTRCVWRLNKKFVDSTSTLSPQSFRVIQEKLEAALTYQLNIERERGNVQTVSIDECNTSFIEKHYPDLNTRVHSYPLIPPMHKASQSTSDVQAGQKKSLQKTRTSFIAEQNTVRSLLAMLESRELPSFIIWRYEWEQSLPQEICKVLKENNSTDTTSINERSTHGKFTKDKSTYSKSTDYKPIDDKSTNGRATNDEKFVKKGESDVLILLPFYGVLVIEVKSQDINNKKALVKELQKCAGQWSKVIKFVAYSTLDITNKKSFAYVKIGSVPNVSREEIRGVFCDKCSQHCITKDEIISKNALSKWFENIIKLLKCRAPEFDWEVYKGMVARFIGPLSRVKVISIVEAIDETHNQLNSLLSQFKWDQLSKQEIKTLLQTRSFLWIIEGPDSVKSFLTWWKGVEISDVNGSKRKKLICIITGNQTTNMMEHIETFFQFYPNKKVQIETNTLANISKSNCQNFTSLVSTIKKLTSQYSTYNLSIIFDGIELENNNNPNQELSPWKTETLRNVWIIQSPACKLDHEPSKLVLSGFQTVRLKSVKSHQHSTLDFLKRRFQLRSEYKPSLPPSKIECIRSHKSKWVQLTEEQIETAFSNESYLWIMGNPGSGKTTLALQKIQTILKSAGDRETVIYLIAGSRNLMLIETMRNRFQSEIKSKPNVSFQIKCLEDVFNSTGCHLKRLLSVIEGLKSSHAESEVSIIIDEFWLFDNDVMSSIDIKWKIENLSNLWIILNSACEITPETSSLRHLGFEILHMTSIMRLTESNVNFINDWLTTSFKVGHALQGLRPVSFKMECICDKLQTESENNCKPLLITKLTEKAISDLKQSLDENEGASILEDVAIITKMHVEVKKLLTQKEVNVTVRPARFYTGCEKKVVIIDVRSVGGSGNYRRVLIEALTRATSRIVLLDAYCKHERQDKRVETIVQLCDRLQEVASLEKRPTVSLKQRETNALQRDIDLGLFRNEQHVQENMGLLITRDMLENTKTQTIINLGEKIKNSEEFLQDSISQTRTALEDTVSQTKTELEAKIDNLQSDVSEMKQLLRTLTTALRPTAS